MPTGKLLGQEAVTRKTRPQLSELNCNVLFDIRLERGVMVLCVTLATEARKTLVGSQLTVGKLIPEV